MRILITGGAGFQGCHLSKKLLQQGHEVIILNTWSKRAENNLRSFILSNFKVILDGLSTQNENNIELLNFSNFKIIWGTVTDKNLIEKTVRDIDLVFHLASNISVDDSIDEPIKYYEVNVLGTNNILELCKKRNIPLIYVSSCEVYGDQKGILTESSPFLPNSPYASSKAGADAMCYAYYKTYDMRLNILRPCNVFGPLQKFGHCGAVIPILMKSAFKNEGISIYGTGEQTREFVYVDDLIDAYKLVIDRVLSDEKFKGNIFNIGSGNVISINELARLIVKLTGSESVIGHVISRHGEVNRFQLNSELFKKEFDWNAKFSIEDGLKEYINFIRDPS